MTRHRMLGSIAALLVLACLPGLAQAKVRVVAKGATATFELTHELSVQSPESTHFFLDLPQQASLLSARAVYNNQPVTLSLMPASKASSQFEAMKARPWGRRPGAALLLSEGPYPDMISVSESFPEPGRGRLQVTVEAPTCFAKNHRYLQVPSNWAQDLRSQGWVVLRELEPVAEWLYGHCPYSEKQHGIWAGFEVDTRISAEAHRFVRGSEVVVKLEIALPEPMSALPQDLFTVFVIDASRSISPGQALAQWAAMDEYASQARAARFALVEFSRHARVKIAPWTDADGFRKASSRPAEDWAGTNGSNIDEGIHLAGQLLASAKGTKRVVVFTDKLAGSRLRKPRPRRGRAFFLPTPWRTS